METTPRLIASANTTAGFAIGIIRTGTSYGIVRMDPQSRYVILAMKSTESAARTRANLEYRKDMGR